MADYNPRAVGNLIEGEDGSFALIDLESNFVSPFLPPAAIAPAIRLAQYPSFDDIDIPRLRAYTAARGDLIEERLGRDGAARLRERASRWEQKRTRGAAMLTSRR